MPKSTSEESNFRESLFELIPNEVLRMMLENLTDLQRIAVSRTNRIFNYLSNTFKSSQQVYGLAQDIQQEIDHFLKIKSLKFAEAVIMELKELNILAGTEEVLQRQNILLDSINAELIRSRIDNSNSLDISCMHLTRLPRCIFEEKSLQSYWQNLQTLNCSFNKIRVLDLNFVPELRRLYCSDNSLSKLDLSSVPTLLRLGCSNNKLNILDLSFVLELQWLDCSYNRLQDLDISSDTALEMLDCSGNYFKSFENFIFNKFGQDPEWVKEMFRTQKKLSELNEINSNNYMPIFNEKLPKNSQDSSECNWKKRKYDDERTISRDDTNEKEVKEEEEDAHKNKKFKDRQ